MAKPGETSTPPQATEAAPVSVPEPVVEPVTEGLAEPVADRDTPMDPVVQSEPLPLPAQKPARRGGFVAPFLGGVAAAAIGFALSHYNVFQLRSDLDPEAVTARLNGLEAKITEEAGAASAAGKAAADQASAAEAAARQGAEGLAALTTRIDGLEQQLQAQAEALPDGTIPPAAFAALKAEVDALAEAAKSAPAAAPDAEALRQQIEAELDARAGEVAAEAERAAEATRQAALRDAAWISLNEAVKTGQPYAEALTALGIDPVPAGLAAHAAEGLPSAQTLAESFPDAARAALDASLRADESGGFGDRALSLLRVTTGARSLTPQAGTDPDAVLSRAEAAVKAGDLPVALTELDGLPPEGQAAMQAWKAQAQSRIDAEAALAALKP